jgi:DNA-directed RNA polymerase beta' subunit
MSDNEEGTGMNDVEYMKGARYDWSFFGLELDSAEAYRQRSEYEVKSKEDLLSPPSDELFGHIELATPCLRIECIQDVMRTIEGMLNSDEELLLDKPTAPKIRRDGTTTVLSMSDILNYLEQSEMRNIKGGKGVLSHDISSRPENMVLRVLPVPPKLLRENMRQGDDLTVKLLDIIRLNVRLVENKKLGAPETILRDLGELIQYHITTYLDNKTAGIPPARQANGKPLSTIAQFLKGTEWEPTSSEKEE